MRMPERKGVFEGKREQEDGKGNRFISKLECGYMMEQAAFLKN